MTPYLSPLDLCILRQTCKTLSIIRSNENPTKIYAFQWACKEGRYYLATWIANSMKKWDFGLCTIAVAASKRDQLAKHELIKTLYSEQPSGDIVCLGAVHSNDSELLKWALEKWIHGGERVCAEAAAIGNLEILKEAIGAKNPCKWDEETCYLAALNGHLHVLIYAHENGCRWDERTCAGAAAGGHLELLVYAKENGCPWNEETCYEAARNGNLDIVQYARQQGCPWDRRVCSSAVSRRDFRLLQYVVENGCPLDADLCAVAAFHGELEMIILMKRYGCPWSPQICFNAARNGHWEVLQYAIQHGCPWNNRTCAAAKLHNNPELTKRRKYVLTAVFPTNIFHLSPSSFSLHYFSFLFIPSFLYPFSALLSLLFLPSKCEMETLLVMTTPQR